MGMFAFRRLREQELLLRKWPLFLLRAYTDTNGAGQWQ
jgi:hypothetical protein